MVENTGDQDIYVPKTDGYRIWLFGDSILDNSYWNGVEKNMTSEVLRNTLKKIEVKDRSTEELDSVRMTACLKESKPFEVGAHYVKHRNEMGIPYDEAPSGAVKIDPEFGEKDFVVISVGGNDFALFGEMDPTVILGRVQDIVKFYKEPFPCSPLYRKRLLEVADVELEPDVVICFK